MELTLTEATGNTLELNETNPVLELIEPDSSIVEILTASDTVVEVAFGNVGGSAYEIAVAGGFVGTEADWLESLGSTVPGPPNSLTIGTVQEGAVPSASITGTPPNQVLDLTLKTGATGPANTLTVGTITQIPAGGTPTASVTGTAPNQTLNLGLVDGDVAGLVTSLGDLASDLDSTNSDVNDLTTRLGGLSLVVTDDYASITSPDPWTLYIEVPEIPEVP